MQNQKLGLIMPTRNVQSMVTKILNGITELQWADIHKLIIVDNGSSDNTVNEVQNFILKSEHAPKIHLYENGADLGYGFSVNRGLKYLTQDLETNFVGIIHADDQFSSEELINLYFSNLNLENNNVFLVNRKRDSSASLNIRQELRNFGNFLISILGRISTGGKVIDFNTPFFLISQNLSKHLVSEYNFGDDIFFHSRINLIFASQYNCNSSECNWKRASKTTKIPIILMGFQIFSMYLKFGILFRLLKYDANESYHRATNL
jgi:glycosyltransferase involved in cell wall biosynthesis